MNISPLSLIMLDIDHFKQYNDNFGHLIGDQVLTVLTQTIRQYIKSSDALGRWGGE
jgi:diguanylate cyclase